MEIFENLTNGSTPLILILISALLHATLNAFWKSTEDKLVIRSLIAFLSMVFALPFTLIVPLPTNTLLYWLILSALIHYGYQIFLVNAYDIGDLSQVYPIARGIAPPIATMGALLFFSEILSPLSYFGIALVCIGIIILSFKENNSIHIDNPFESRKVLFLSFATGLCIALYTVIDAKGVRLAQNPLTFIVWLFVFDGVLMSLTAIALRWNNLYGIVKENFSRGLFLTLLAMGSYGLALLALKVGKTGEIAALREVSVIIAAFIGVVFLKETIGPKRILAAIIVTIGTILIGLF